MAGTISASPVLLTSSVYPSSVGKRRAPFVPTRGSDKLNVKLSRVRTRLEWRRLPIKRRNCDTILRGSSDIQLKPLNSLGPIEEGHGKAASGAMQGHSRKPARADATV